MKRISLYLIIILSVFLAEQSGIQAEVKPEKQDNKSVNSESVPAAPVYTPDQLRKSLRRGGVVRRTAIYYIHENKTDSLIRQSLGYLFTSNDPDDHRAILISLKKYGPSLENYIPDWYTILDRFMRDDTPEDILLECIEMAGYWKEHRMIPALTRLSDHPSSVIRTAAFRTMGMLNNDGLIPALLRLLSSDNSVDKIRGLEGAAYYDDSRIHPFVLKLLDDPDPSVQFFAVETVSILSKNDNFMNMVVRLYRPESSPGLREAVIRNITEHNWRRFASILYRGINDSEARVRIASIEGVMQFQEQRAATVISQQLMTETDNTVKLLGLNALIFLERNGGGEGISHVIRYELDPLIRIRAVTAAQVLEDRNAVKAVTDALYQDPSAMVRLEAAYALGVLLDKPNSWALLASIGNPKEIWDVRAAAMVSYIQVEGRKNSPELAAILQSEEKSMLYKQWEAVP